MRLEIDVGNTRLKWRFLNKGVVVNRGYTSHSDGICSDVFHDDISKVDQVVVSTVADDAIKSDIKMIFGTADSVGRVHFIESNKMMAGIEFAYSDVSRLGVDRCLAMIGAFQRINEGVLVVDCGSAITADFVSKEGEHLGGYILPGVSILKSALLSGTAKVLVEKDVTLSVEPGITTEQCVDHGRYFLLKSMMQGLLETSARYGISNVYLTGGDGEVVQRICGMTGTYIEDLVFEGMKCIVPLEP